MLQVALSTYTAVKSWYKADDWVKLKEEQPVNYKIAAAYLKAKHERTT